MGLPRAASRFGSHGRSTPSRPTPNWRTGAGRLTTCQPRSFPTGGSRDGSTSPSTAALRKPSTMSRGRSGDAALPTSTGNCAQSNTSVAIMCGPCASGAFIRNTWTKKGLVALWREALLAQAVLRRIARRERSVGYANHPQLSRFLAQRLPMASLALYMRTVHEESLKRGCRFQASRIDGAGDCRRIEVTAGQLRFERRHLLAKLKRREPDHCDLLAADPLPVPNPLFKTVPGGVAEWERA